MRHRHDGEHRVDAARSGRVVTEFIDVVLPGGRRSRCAYSATPTGEVTVEFSGWRFRKAFIVRFIKPILAGSQVGVQFDELTQEEREKLVKQVFDVQRAQLQAERKR